MGPLGEIPLAVRTGHPVSEGTKLRDLHDFLRPPKDEKIQRADVSLENIQAFLEKQVDGRLSKELVSLLGFDQLQWQMLYFPGAYSLVSIGTKEKPPKDTQIAQTFGTIELNRSIPSNTNLPPNVFVEDVRVAGIKGDDERILAVAYNGKNKAAYRINVSLGQHEDPFPESNGLFTKLPFDHQYPYRMAGLITDAMVTQTEHAKAIDAYRSSDKSEFSLRYRFGLFDIGTGAKSLVVNYRPNPFDQHIEAKPWSLEIPSRLAPKKT